MERKREKVKRKKSKRLDVGIREVPVLLPLTQKNQEMATDFFWSEQGRRCVLGKKILYVPCRTNMEIRELRNRIGGKTKIPPERMTLFYVGKLLLDGDEIPFDVLDDLTDAASDEDIFKARIFLSIQFVGPSMEDHDVREDVTCDKICANTGEHNSGNRKVWKEVFDNEYKQKLITSFQYEANLCIEAKPRCLEYSEFDIMKEMKQINCDNFVMHLSQAGYDNTGAFGAMEEEDLRKGALLIPRSARVRILTLAGIVQRRSAIFDKDERKKIYKSLEKGLLGSSSVKALTLEGENKIYTTKAALQQSWEKKGSHEDAKEEASKPTMARIHSHDVQAIIDQIRTNYHVDDKRINLRRGIVGEPKQYCCAKHFHEAIEIREKFIELRKQNNVAYLESLLRRIDISENGYMSREVFQTLIQDILRKNLHTSVSGSTMVNLLDVCVMAADEQLLKQDWAGECERNYNLGRIPLPIYHTGRFVRLAAALLTDCDRAKFIDCIL